MNKNIYYEPDTFKMVYDSVQIYLDMWKGNNINTEIILLKFLNKKSDTVEYVLSTFSKECLTEEYSEYYYTFNIDSSILIIQENEKLFTIKVKYKDVLKNISRYRLNDTMMPIIFDPVFCKITIVNSEIIIDRDYEESFYDKPILN